MNAIKWISIIVFATFLSWLIPMILRGYDVGSFNSLPEHERQFIVEESAGEFSDSRRPILKDEGEAMTIQVPIQQPSPTTSKIQFKKFKKLSMSRADKLCNDAIFSAMGDHSDKAKQAKKEACAHNAK
ncbi:hypothetical protein CMT41_01630 [Colwellia sp. MT41]|uniref:Uncharacterized protein n=1 Tax=Colwellia marinimaniae TaxID=1513592 RepID=A0ABQ0N018_9GAMM|nr:MULTISPECIES: hypothetical protein [Colwellia]ALO33554.1 hypothetical protein CMT41_01630 [Colwellia sp. MT41]GAW97962.1 hypothetical protein MTCD1_03617 [Colwellia marinimaniae]